VLLMTPLGIWSATAPATRPRDETKLKEQPPKETALPQLATLTDTAQAFLLYLKNKDIESIKSLSLGASKGWIDRPWPGSHLLGLNAQKINDFVDTVHKNLFKDNPDLSLKIDETVVIGEWGAVKVSVPTAPDMIICLLFRKLTAEEILREQATNVTRRLDELFLKRNSLLDTNAKAQDPRIADREQYKKTIEDQIKTTTIEKLEIEMKLAAIENEEEKSAPTTQNADGAWRWVTIAEFNGSLKKTLQTEMADLLEYWPQVVKPTTRPADYRRSVAADMDKTLIALQAFDLDMGRYPSAKEGLDILAKNDDGKLPDWKGPYIRFIPKDPWGMDYRYLNPGKRDKKDFDIISAGPDKKFDTEDDLHD
jgi:type II secretion system protein G